MELTATPQTFADVLSRARERGEVRLEKRSEFLARAKAAWGKTKEVAANIAKVTAGIATPEGLREVKNVAVDKAAPGLAELAVGVAERIDYTKQVATEIRTAPSRLSEQTKEAIRDRIGNARIGLLEKLATMSLDQRNTVDLALFDTRLTLLQLQKSASERITPIVSKARELGGRTIGFFAHQKDGLINGMQLRMNEGTTKWNEAKARAGEIGYDALSRLAEKTADLGADGHRRARAHRIKSVDLRNKAAALRMSSPRPAVAR